MRKIAFLLALTMIASLGACSDKNDTDTSNSESSQSVSDSGSESDAGSSDTDSSGQTSESQSDIDDTIRNPLTGETDYNEEAIGKRPVAVMISNIKAALSQYGIEDADILFEVLVVLVVVILQRLFQLHLIPYP